MIGLIQLPSALELPISDFKVSYTDFKPIINAHVQNTMQSRWDMLTENKLHSIKPTLGEWAPGFRTVRRDEVVLSRLRIGHTRLTHSYLLKGEPAPVCIPCDAPFTVRHILLDCIDFSQSRHRFFNVSSLSELFESTNIEAVLDFFEKTFKIVS